MREIDEGPVDEYPDQGWAMVRWKESPWDVLAELDEQLKPYGLEIVKMDAGSDCIWAVVKIGEEIRHVEVE